MSLDDKRKSYPDGREFDRRNVGGCIGVFFFLFSNIIIIFSNKKLYYVSVRCSPPNSYANVTRSVFFHFFGTNAFDTGSSNRNVPLIKAPSIDNIRFSENINGCNNA